MKVFTKNYRNLMIIPLIVAIVLLVLIFITPKIKQGIDLTGGNQIIIHYNEEKDYSNLANSIRSNYNLSEVSVSGTSGVNGYGLLIQYSANKDIEDAKAKKALIDFDVLSLSDLKKQTSDLLQPLINKGYIKSDVLTTISESKNKDEIKSALNLTLVNANSSFNDKVVNTIKTELKLEDSAKIQTREVAATLGKSFIKSSITVGIIAFIFLIIVILVAFREIIPSSLIIFAAVFDIFAALATMAIFNVPLSLTTIPALLMLIGYSVDTDILVSTKLLKEHGDHLDKSNEAMKTGMTMTLTTICALSSMLIIAYFTQMIIVFEIAVVLLGGLIGDIISTWFFNTPALLNYVYKKDKKTN
ncbi:MAG: MMPL family transporter [archaeon]